MSSGRVAAVTGGLVVVGGIAGALASMLAVALAIVLTGGVHELARMPPILFLGGVFGAVYGAVLGPVAAWALMRHVPLWLAIGGTMLGTMAGGLAALLIEDFFFSLPLVGFVVAAVAMRILVPRRPSAEPAPRISV